MEPTYITIVGFSNYYGKEPFRIGAEFLCEKEPDNSHDCEAIKVTYPVLGTVGYIANSTHTRANGTMSAGRIYEKVSDSFTVRIRFATHTKVIAEVTDRGISGER